MHWFASCQPLTVEPQEIGQLASITSIGLLFGWFLWMNEDDFMTLPFVQFGDQPIVKTANFENRHEIGIHFGELLKEGFDLLSTRTYLSAQNCVSIRVPDTNGDLLAVLVNSEVQHYGSPGVFGEPNGYAVK